MKEFSKYFIQKECEQYYKNTGKEPELIFVFSSKQNNIKDIYFLEEISPYITTINGVAYSECRLIESNNYAFNWNDTKFICVGCYDEIEINRL